MAGYKGTWWDSLSSMMQTFTKEGGSDKFDATFKINDKPSQVLASFYEQWSVYLKPIPQVFIFCFQILDLLSKGLYVISYVLESVFNRVFSLFGFFDLLTQADSFPATVFGWLRILGVALFILFLVVKVVVSMFTTTFKYKEFLNNLILVTAATSFLPQAVVSFSQYVAESSQALSGYNVTSKKSGSSLSAQPFETNTVDLMMLIKNNFNAEKLGREKGDDGFINPSKLGSGVRLNSLNNSNITSTDLGMSYGANNEEMLKYFSEKGGVKTNFDGFVQDINPLDNKDLTKNNYYGVATILHSELRTNEYKSDGSAEIVEVVGHKSHSILKPLNMSNPGYLRYKVNWIGLYIQQLMLIFILAGLLINVIMTIFKVMVSTMIAPIVGYSSVDDSTKLLELLQSIFASIAGIWFEVLMVKFGLWFISIAPSMRLGGGTEAFGTGGGFFQNVVAMIALYIAVFVATVQGSRSIESWLGISTGASRGMIIAGGALYGATKVGKGVEKATIGQRDRNGVRHGGSIGHAMKDAKSAWRGNSDPNGSPSKNSPQAFGQRLSKGTKNATMSAASTFGAGRGAVQANRENGSFTQTVKNGYGNSKFNQRNQSSSPMERMKSSVSNAGKNISNNAQKPIVAMKNSQLANQMRESQNATRTNLTTRPGANNSSSFGGDKVYSSVPSSSNSTSSQDGMSVLRETKSSPKPSNSNSNKMNMLNNIGQKDNGDGGSFGK